MPRQPDDVPDATFRLILASGIGHRTLRRLRATFGTDERITAAGSRELEQIEGIGRATARSLLAAIASATPDDERRAMAAAGASLVLHGDPDYPPLLAAIDDPPPALWVRGRPIVEASLPLAIVGSRRCTSYGRTQSGRFASQLSAAGVTIVSGGARGIDAEAHHAALRVGRPTIVVLGSGLGRPYPPEHAELFDRIVAAGGTILSELPTMMPPRPGHFPRRNRIISGLSVGVLVIEAGARSGALITARLGAEDHGREVMAVPGRVDAPQAAGCLRAIREGWAALVVDHRDVLAQLEVSPVLLRGAAEAAARPTPTLSADQRAIVEAIAGSASPIDVDTLAAATELDLGELLAEITMLEIRGVLRRVRGCLELAGDHLRAPAGNLGT